MNPRPLPAPVPENPRPLRAIAGGLTSGLERMVRIQMEAAPAHWSEPERRAWAEVLLFARRRQSCQDPITCPRDAPASDVPRSG